MRFDRQHVGALVIGFVGVAFGMAASHFLSDRDTTTIVEREHQTTGATRTEVVTRERISSSALRAEIAGIVRDELRAALASAGTVSIQIAEASPQEPTPEQDAAERDAMDLLDAARRAHTWTEQDKARLGALSRTLSDEGRQEVILALARAINGGELRITTRGGPL